MKLAKYEGETYLVVREGKRFITLASLEDGFTFRETKEEVRILNYPHKI